jgi:SAM-dependent methyltransferase
VDEQAQKAFYEQEMAARAVRPLGPEREARVADFVAECARRGLASVVEVGCGAGRDGVLLRDGGLTYRGLDTSSASVRICTDLGLDVVEGTALFLPFDDDAFDAGWSMSTLMHLPGDGMSTALAELSRVVRPGGIVDVGVWGAERTRQVVDEHGRLFYGRSDDDLMVLLRAVGEVVGFDTWDRHADGGYYQCARILVR